MGGLVAFCTVIFSYCIIIIRRLPFRGLFHSSLVGLCGAGVMEYGLWFLASRIRRQETLQAGEV
jgi:hypothetical protein